MGIHKQWLGGARPPGPPVATALYKRQGNASSINCSKCCWFAGAGAGLPVRGCGVCVNAGFRGLYKCGVVQIFSKYVNAGVVVVLVRGLTLILTLTLSLV